MKRAVTIILAAVLITTVSCKNKSGNTESENNIDAARNFIRAALDGKFREARYFLLADSVNLNYLDVAERSYERADKPTKDGYRGANIHIHQVQDKNDSTSIIIFSNSYKNDQDTLRVVKRDGQWLVDLKYLFEHDRDSIPVWQPVPDTLP